MKNLRRVIATLALMFIAISAVAQDVRWSHSLREEGGDRYTLVIEAKIAPEMHIYGVTPNADCFPTVINFTPSEGAKLEGAIKVVTPPHVVNGVEEFKDKAIFEQKIVGESGSSVTKIEGLTSAKKAFASATAAASTSRNTSKPYSECPATAPSATAIGRPVIPLLGIPTPIAFLNMLALNATSIF